MPKYRVGMYGGKFMPFHKGHLYCIEEALKQCEKLYVLLMIGGAQEQEILRNATEEQLAYLTPEARIKNTKRVLDKYPNIIFRPLDISTCFTPSGEEDWDAETPIVKSACEPFNAVFGSEPHYKAYFNRAYPEAEYILIDVLRNKMPISATKIRSMNKEEALLWMP